MIYDRSTFWEIKEKVEKAGAELTDYVNKHKSSYSTFEDIIKEPKVDNLLRTLSVCRCEVEAMPDCSEKKHIKFKIAEACELVWEAIGKSSYSP